MCEVIIEGNKIKPSEGPSLSSAFKDLTQEDLYISKTMVRLQRIEAEEHTTRIMIRGVKEEIKGCKKKII